MRQPYVSTRESHALYHSALNDDLGIYRVQSGAGIGGFLKKMFSKYVVPLGKTVLKQGIEIAKPELNKMANNLKDAAVEYGTNKLNSGLEKLGQKVDGVVSKSKRKRDALS